MPAHWTTRAGRTLSPQTPKVKDVMAIQFIFILLALPARYASWSWVRREAAA